MKKVFAIYYEHDGAAAKQKAKDIRAAKDTAIVVDATFAKEPEVNVSTVLFTDEVSAPVRDRILAMYAEEPVTVGDAPAEDAGKINVPENWKRLPWPAMQALASEIAPNETIRTKEDAKRIIADYVDDNGE